MSESPGPTSSPEARTGRARTAWHPLLGRLLRWLLQEGYEVRDEVSVGAMPLRLDFIVRRESGKISPVAASYLPELASRLRRRTFIEFKGPTDALEGRDWDGFLGHTFLFLEQEAEPIASNAISLIVIAPALTKPFIDRLALRECRVDADPLDPGVHRISGGPFEAWVIETDEMAKRHRPVLSLFSRLFLRQLRDIMRDLAESGHMRMLPYVLQQIRQFKDLTELWADMMLPDVGGPELPPEVVDAFLQMFPPETRVKGLSPEERLEGLSPEERLEGLSPEERLKGLSPEELRRLKRLLDANGHAQDADNT
jgi:hypothetical protein